jgi:hypothetical protein
MTFQSFAKDDGSPLVDSVFLNDGSGFLIAPNQNGEA